MARSAHPTYAAADRYERRMARRRRPATLTTAAAILESLEVA